MELQAELWLERFSQWMRLRNWSEETVKAYCFGLRQFFDYLDAQGVCSLAVVTRDLVEGFRTHLYHRRYRGEPISVATQSARLQAAKSFLRYLAKENYLLVDVASTVDLPKAPRPLPRVLSEDQVVLLLEAPDLSLPSGVRDRAVLEVFYATAIRNGELGALCLEDIDWEHKALWIRLGKGQKSRLVPLGEEALAWLEEYLGQVRPRWATSEKQKRVFLSSLGRPLQRSGIGTIVARWAEKVSLSDVTPHTLRHSCATHMLRRGAGIRHLQEMLGHSSPLTTEHYTQVELSDLHKVLRRCHPRERHWGR